MPAQEEKLVNNDMLWTHFDTTPAISAHLVGAIMARFPEVGVWQNKLYSWISVPFAQSVAENVTLYLESEWKRSDTISIVHNVVIPGFQDKGIVNFKLILYG